MAETSFLVDQDQFKCPFCEDLLKDPVAIPCGHSFCMGCIIDCWDQDDQRGIYSCPQCRETFTPRPVLCRNNLLANVLEKIQAELKKKTYLQSEVKKTYLQSEVKTYLQSEVKKTDLQSAPHVLCSTGPGDVECDFCTGRKHKAIKSCLMCQASFCETHLQPHYEVPGLKRHTLVKVSSQIQQKFCSQHDEVKKIYCRTDQSFICFMCTMEDHKGHDAVAAATERAQKQRGLKEEQRKLQQRIQEKEKKVQELQQAVDTLKCSAQTAVEDSEKIFTELICSIEKKRCEVRELIRAQEKAELSPAEGLLDQLDQEITDLKRRNSELEQLSHTEDHIHFLQSFQSLSVSTGSNESHSIPVIQHLSFDGVKKSLFDLRERLEEFWKEQFNKIPPQRVKSCPPVKHNHVAAVQILLSEPNTRGHFLKYFCHLTLDPNTAHRCLSLSEMNRVVRWSGKFQPYCAHPDRFDGWVQVLSKETVRGLCYWEVEWTSKGGMHIAVSYKGISRKGNGHECGFGLNPQSWSLRCSSSLSFWHNNIKTEIPDPPSSRIGVYVDHSAGTLSFYRVSDTMSLLHTVHTTFTQPLYAGVCVYGSTLRLCDPK
ncbi:tripartite motif-containing protein 16-like isoform X2 [Brachyhypopomus gauderio]|uniref:tripartite motif-containing protein 16-like isoform X2 n=1 Tax=Brachyhypopomus gauderio TaxID=698409 RepID=UPI004042849A